MSEVQRDLCFHETSQARLGDGLERFDLHAGSGENGSRPGTSELRAGRLDPSILVEWGEWGEWLNGMGSSVKQDALQAKAACCMNRKVPYSS